MEISWKCISLCYSLLFCPLCNAYPSRNLEGIVADQHVQFLTGLVGVLLIVCSLVFLAGCLCCQRRHNFKEFRDSPVVASVPSDLDHGHVNPIANGEFTIFTPLSPPLFNNNLFLPREHIVTSKLESYMYEGTDLSEWFNESEKDFPRIKLKYVRELGRGKFGKVVEGAIQDVTEIEGEWTPVVVRILDSASSHEERLLFLKDALMYRYPHPNILRLYGKCLESIPFLLLQEHYQVDLKSYLRSVFVNEKNTLSSEYPLLWSTQLTSALKHLHSLGITHPDLACRNCQLSSDLTLKLGDYSLSTSKYPGDYYRGATSVPIRWCDPESVDFSEDAICLNRLLSENIIWSLGVTLWEICQHGEQPYSDLNDDEVITQVLRSNLRLQKPTFKATYMDYLYQLMQSCWRNLESRPNISQIHLILADILQLQRNSSVHTSDACSVSSDDFDRKWELLKPNSVVKSDHISDSISIEMNDTDIKITKPLSPSLNNLHGSLDNLLLEKNEPHVNFHFEDEIKTNCMPGNKDGLHEDICHSDSSDQGSLKINTSFNINESTNSDIRNFVYQRTSSGSETEDENWRNKVERGAYTEKVRMKSRSVADLMVLTHVDYSESESETPLPSLDFRVNYKPLRNNLESSHVFSSEGNLLSIQDTFQEELRKLQEERKDSLLFVPDSSSSNSPSKQSNVENDSLIKEANITSLANSTKLLRELSSPERIQPVNQVYNVFNVSVKNHPAVYDKSKLNEIISFNNPFKYETEVTEAKLNQSNKVTADFNDFHKQESIICDNNVEKNFKSKYGNSFNVPSQLLNVKQSEYARESHIDKLQDLKNTIDSCLIPENEQCAISTEIGTQSPTVALDDQILFEHLTGSGKNVLEELNNTIEACLIPQGTEYKTRTKVNTQLPLEYEASANTNEISPAFAVNEVVIGNCDQTLFPYVAEPEKNKLEEPKNLLQACLVPEGGEYECETNIESNKMLPAVALNKVLICSSDQTLLLHRGEPEKNKSDKFMSVVEACVIPEDRDHECEMNKKSPSSSIHEESQTNKFEELNNVVQASLIPESGQSEGKTNNENDTVSATVAMNEVLCINDDQISTHIGDTKINNLDYIKPSTVACLIPEEKYCETAVEANTQAPLPNVDPADICDHVVSDTFPENSKLEMELPFIGNNVLLEDIHVDCNFDKEMLEKEDTDIKIQNSLKILDDVIEAVYMEDQTSEALESQEIFEHSDLDEIENNKINIETELIQLNEENSDQNASSLGKLPEHLSLQDNVENGTINCSVIDKSVSNEQTICENVSDTLENKNHRVATTKLGEFDNLISNTNLLNQFLSTERNHSESLSRSFLNKFDNDMLENLSVSEIPNKLENEIFNTTLDPIEFDKSELGRNLQNEDDLKQTALNNSHLEQCKDNSDKKLTIESKAASEEMSHSFNSKLSKQIKSACTKSENNEDSTDKNKSKGEIASFNDGSKSLDKIVQVEGNILDLSAEPKILVDSDHVPKESSVFVEDEVTSGSDDQKMADILPIDIDQKNSNLVSPDEQSSYEFLSCEGNLENELYNTSESLYSILDPSEFDAVRSDVTTETCIDLKDSQITIETNSTRLELDNHLLENLSETQCIEETKTSLTDIPDQQTTPADDKSDFNHSECAHSSLDEVNFDLSANQEEAMPNSLTHSYAFTSTPMRRKRPIPSGDNYSSLNLFDSSDEKPADDGTCGFPPTEITGNRHENLSYSLETWDNFLDKTLDNQQHENLFDSFSSEPKSLLFVENEDIANGETRIVINNDKEQLAEAENKHDGTFKVEPKNGGENTFIVEETNHDAVNVTVNKEKPELLGLEDLQDSWESGDGWFLHPQSTEEVSGEIQISASISDSYVGFGIDDEIMSAIRNELLSKLPHAQGSSVERIRNETELDSQEPNEVFLRYNVYNTPLSPIPEESLTEEDSESNTPRQRVEDEDSDWSDHCDVPQDTESQSTRTLEGYSRGPLHRHTPSQDSCCSNDTLFNLEELNFGATDGERENEQLSPKLVEEEIVEENQDKTFIMASENERHVESPFETDKNKEAEFAALYDSAYQNFLNKFILSEREHSSNNIESPDELTRQENFVFNKVHTVPLPSPDNNPWKQLPVSLLSSKSVIAQTNGSPKTDVPEYVNTVVDDLEDDHLYETDLLEDDQNPGSVYANCDEKNSQDLENDYDNYINFVNMENAKNSLECNSTDRDYVNIVESNKDEANSEDDQVFGILTDIRFNGPTDNQLMSTSFSESNNCDEQEWDSGSDSRSSSSGEFIWKEGEHEESLKALRAAPQDVLEDIKPMEKIAEDQYEGSDISSFSDEDGDTPEFIPSAWDKFAMPSKSALRSPEKTLNKTGAKKAKVWFKKQKYHCIYEYPKEPESPILQSQDLWKPQNDSKAYADWEFDGEPYCAASDEFDAPLTYQYKSRNLPSNSLYHLTDVSDVMPGNSEMEEEFFVSSSSQPFNITSTSQFFPGHSKWGIDHMISSSTENATPDSGVEDITPGSQTDCNEYTKIKQSVPTLKQLASACVNKTKQVNVKNEDVLGGLRHTRNKLKLDLPPSPSAFTTEKMFVIEDNFEPVTRDKPTFTTFGKSRFFVQHIDTPEDETQSRNVSFEALPYKPIQVTVTSKEESQDVQKNNAFNLTNSTTKKDTLNDEDPDIVKVKIEIVRGEASLLDSADEDSGIESSTLERKLSNV